MKSQMDKNSASPTNKTVSKRYELMNDEDISIMKTVKPLKSLTQASQYSQSTAASPTSIHIDTQLSFFRFPIHHENVLDTAKSNTTLSQNMDSPLFSISEACLSPCISRKARNLHRNMTDQSKASVSQRLPRSYLSQTVSNKKPGTIDQEIMPTNRNINTVRLNDLSPSSRMLSNNFTDASSFDYGGFDTSNVLFSPKQETPPQTTMRQFDSENTDLVKSPKQLRRHEQAHNELQHLRKDFTSFIRTNFKPSNYSRLKTFEKFAFTSIERDEHKDVLPILEDLRTIKEAPGTMCTSDLWSKRMQRDLLFQTEFLAEKNKLEKFGFYQTVQKLQKKNSTQLKIIDNKNERVLKDIIYRRAQKEEFDLKQNKQLLQEFDMKKKSVRSSALKLSQILKPEHNKVKDIFAKIHEVDIENKSDYKKLQQQVNDHESWINKMKRHKTFDEKDDKKLKDLKQLKFLVH